MYMYIYILVHTIQWKLCFLILVCFIVRSLAVYACSVGPNVRTLVLDVGWSKTVLTAVDVSSGLFFPVASKQSAAVSGAVFVQALTDFCAKVDSHFCNICR